MERFPNFPQTIDPVESETILEQFLELNNNVQKINQGYNELAPQVDTNTTDIAQLKTQFAESGTRVKVNGQLVAEWSPDVLSSDVATNAEDIEQIRLAQSSDSLAIVALQSDNLTNKQNISNLQGDVSSLNQTMQRTLKVPLSFPPEIELVGVDDNGSQVMVQVDSILSTTSENPVKNNVITEELNKKLSNERVVLYSADLTSFAGQTISADLTPYKYIQILWRIVGGDVQYKAELIPKEFNLSQTTINLLWDTILKRDFIMNSTGITFENGEQITAYGSSGPVSNNNVMIPIYIYGVK